MVEIGYLSKAPTMVILWLSYGYLDGYNGISDLWDFDEVFFGVG